VDGPDARRPRLHHVGAFVVRICRASSDEDTSVAPKQTARTLGWWPIGTGIQALIAVAANRRILLAFMLSTTGPPHEAHTSQGS